MNIIVQYILVIAAIVAMIAALVLRLIKLKTIANWCELVAIGCFVAFTAQYTYLFGRLSEIDGQGICQLLLFGFSIILGAYKVIFFFFLPKR